MPRLVSGVKRKAWVIYMSEMDLYLKRTTQNIESVLVTGAGGFLGGELIKQLSATTNYQIFALTSQKEKVLSRFSEVKQLACFDIEEWMSGKLPWEEIDTLIHCAFARVSSGQELASSLNFANELFKEARENKITAVINVSSQGVYGRTHKPLWSEETPVDPHSIYGFAKYASELLLNNLRAVNDNQTFTTNLRLSSLSGGAAGLKFEVISKFVNHALRGEPIKIVGGKQIFSYMDVRDAAAGIIALLTVCPQEWQEVYNLGSNRGCTIIEIANLVAEAAPSYTAQPVRIEIEAQDINLNIGMNSNLFYKATNWQPQYDMKDIVASLFQYLSPKANN